MTNTASLANSQAAHPLSPAERTARLLAFKGPTHNFGGTTPSKPIHRATGANRTA